MSNILLQISFDERLGVTAESVTVYANMGSNGLQILRDVNTQLKTFSCRPLAEAVFKITNTSSGRPKYIGPMATLASSGFQLISEPGRHVYKAVAYKDTNSSRGECLIL
ncbi:hypothetical protein H4R19_000897 [Coemansia spiralis]|nr:hypothetical protein H4R19_000897 [Coemansia spiralis]